MGSNSALEGELGHRFADPALLQTALTHASMLASRGRADISNERMEFLGDRVLGLVIADFLYQRFSDEAEGRLARRLAALVSRDSLAHVAQEIGLGDHIRMMEGEEAGGGRLNPALLANGCEAVIAALYLDGGLETARRFIHDQWTPLVDALTAPPKDNKTTLQEWAQAQKLGLPTYEIVNREGPAHAPVFTVRVNIADREPAEAEGASRRTAEQAAAGVFLARAGIGS